MDLADLRIEVQKLKRRVPRRDEDDITDTDLEPGVQDWQLAQARDVEKWKEKIDKAKEKAPEEDKHKYDKMLTDLEDIYRHAAAVRDNVYIPPLRSLEDVMGEMGAALAQAGQDYNTFQVKRNQLKQMVMPDNPADRAAMEKYFDDFTAREWIDGKRNDKEVTMTARLMDADELRRELQKIDADVSNLEGPELRDRLVVQLREIEKLHDAAQRDDRTKKLFLDAIKKKDEDIRLYKSLPLHEAKERISGVVNRAIDGEGYNLEKMTREVQQLMNRVKESDHRAVKDALSDDLLRLAEAKLLRVGPGALPIDKIKEDMLKLRRWVPKENKSKWDAAELAWDVKDARALARRMQDEPDHDSRIRQLQDRKWLTDNADVKKRLQEEIDAVRDVKNARENEDTVRARVLEIAEHNVNAGLLDAIGLPLAERVEEDIALAKKHFPMGEETKDRLRRYLHTALKDWVGAQVKKINDNTDPVAHAEQLKQTREQYQKWMRDIHRTPNLHALDTKDLEDKIEGLRAPAATRAEAAAAIGGMPWRV